MQISPKIRYAFAMIFIAVALGYSLIQSGVPTVTAAAIFVFVVGGFGIYLYFRLFRQGR